MRRQALIEALAALVTLALIASVVTLFWLAIVHAGDYNQCVRRCAQTWGTPTPVPSITPRPTVAFHCDETMLKLDATDYVRNNLQLQVAVPHTLCVTLPPTTRAFFEVYTINKGDSPCSNVTLVATSPHGVTDPPPGHEPHSGPAPGAAPLTDPGLWAITMTLEYGCDKYDVNVVL